MSIDVRGVKTIGDMLGEKKWIPTSAAEQTRNTSLNYSNKPAAPLSATVQLIYEDNVFSYNVEEIGEAGLSLLGASPISVDEHVKNFLRLPSPKSGRNTLCLIRGNVIWKQKGKTLLEFVDISADSYLMIYEYIRSHNLPIKTKSSNHD